jgi:hypothetical protein
MHKQVFSVLLTLLAFSCCAFAQGGVKVSLSLSANGNVFEPKGDTRIRVKVVNEGPQTLGLDNQRAVRIRLSRPRRYSDCHRSDCWGATFSLSHRREIGPAGSFEFEVNLVDLYWSDSISGFYDIRRPRNLFKAVPSGSYRLFVEVPLPKRNSVNNDVSSNDLVVKVEGSSGPD